MPVFCKHTDFRIDSVPVTFDTDNSIDDAVSVAMVTLFNVISVLFIYP